MAMATRQSPQIAPASHLSVMGRVSGTVRGRVRGGVRDRVGGGVRGRVRGGVRGGVRGRRRRSVAQLPSGGEGEGAGGLGERTAAAPHDAPG